MVELMSKCSPNLGVALGVEGTLVHLGRLVQTIISGHTLVASTCYISRQLCRQGHIAFDPAARVTLRTVFQLYGTSASSSTIIVNRYIVNYYIANY